MTMTIDTPDADFIQETADHELRLQQASEAILWRLARGEELSEGEHAILARQFDDNGKGYQDLLKPEVRRIRSIMRLQERAGRPTEREAAAEHQEDVTHQLDLRTPEIDEQIKQLQEQKRKLQEAVRVAESRLKDMTDAVDSLRDTHLLPDHIHRAYRYERRRNADKLQQHKTRQNRIQTLEDLLGKSDQELRESFVIQDRFRRECMSSAPAPGTPEELQQCRSEWRTELGQLQNIVQVEQPDIDVIETRIRELRDHYLPSDDLGEDE